MWFHQQRCQFLTSTGRLVTVFLLLLTTVVGLSGLAAPQVAAQDQSSFDTRVRFLHADTDATKFEVALDGKTVLDNFEYGTLSDWIGLEAGSARLTITEDRAGVNYTLFDAVYPVPAGNDYEVIITDALVLTSVIDRTPIPDVMARVQIIHAAVDLPTVNVAATGTGTAIAGRLAYGQTSEYVEVPQGSFDLTVRATQTGETAFTQSGVTVEANKVYSLVIMGSPGSEDHPLTITPIDDTTLEREASTPAA